MNYYEELGLTESASVEEIRQAFKSLARLLHPDHQREEQLRKIAELQMIRLNEILAVLCDPLRREEYDASIRSAGVTASAIIEHEMPAWKRIHLGHLRISVGTIVWGASLVVAAVGFSFALLYFEHGSAMSVFKGGSAQGTRPSQPAVPVTSPIKEPAAALATGVRPTKRIVKVDKIGSSMAARVAPVTLATGQNAPQASQPTAPTVPAAPLSEGAQTTPISTIPAVVNLPGLSPPSPGPLVGTWLYSKSSANAGTNGSSVYRPDYIEMVVKSGESGEISGRYLGRFKVSDQALSSEVRFTFEGAVGEGATVLPWRNGDGAEGQVRMKIVSDGVLEVSWYTTKFGTTRKLASGTAVLRRD